jgi:phytoene dehydrogenase-like protein
MTDHYDNIIIGASHNGLVAAAYLARAGRQVLVLEQRAVLGGAAATEEPFPGFRFSSGSPEAGLFRPEIVRDLELEQHSLRFIEPEAAVFAPQPDGAALTLWRDPNRNGAEISRLSAVDAERYPQFLEHLADLTEVLARILLLAPPDLTNLASNEMLPWLTFGLNLRRQGGREMMTFMRTLPTSAREFLDDWFSSEALKGVLGAPAVAGGLPGPMGAGTTFMLLYQHLGGANGGFRSSRLVAGGTGRLSDVLAVAAQGYGAEIRTGAAVQRILLDEFDQRATGVRLADGREILAGAILSSADPRRTFFGLVGGAHLEPAFMRRVANIRYRGATAVLHLALDGLPAFTGATSTAQLQGHILISPSLIYLERAWDDAKYGRISRQPFLDAVIPSLSDPSLAPAGQHVMSVTMQYAPYQLREGSWDERRAELGRLIIDTLAEYAPDLPNLILHQQLLTPADLEREYGLTEGHIYHGQMGLDQLLFMRPVPGFGQYQTPFANLHLCGAGTHPGGGVTGAPGYNAARRLLRGR